MLGATRAASRTCSPASATSRATRRSTARSPFATRSSSRARPTRAGTQSIAGEFLTRLSSDDRVSALSAGERARLALAVALGKRPALLLLDEPFARLDPLAAREFLQLLMDGVSELEATVVIASHVIADIERVSDHIVLLGDGPSGSRAAPRS